MARRVVMMQAVARVVTMQTVAVLLGTGAAIRERRIVPARYRRLPRRVPRLWLTHKVYDERAIEIEARRVIVHGWHEHVRAKGKVEDALIGVLLLAGFAHAYGLSSLVRAAAELIVDFLHTGAPRGRLLLNER